MFAATLLPALVLDRPNAHDIKVKNNAFANDVRKGRPAVRMSSREKAEQKVPLSKWALGAVVFVVIGGVFFELASYMFS
ncbi:hypothetical protein DL93DRAFT_2161868 [Clavulina sp. PMI_390]|nr:hypothetical protein DL93DRAFT_2161868 [Clavulina sp. PMI_390]